MSRKNKTDSGLRLYLLYDETRTGGDPKGEGPYCSREDTNVDVRFKALYRNPPENRFFYDSFEVSEDVYNLEKVHMAVIRYSDGDTFGNTTGLWHVVGIFATLTEATRAIDLALKGEYGWNRPWEGYFASLEDNTVEIMTVFEK